MISRPRKSQTRAWLDQALNKHGIQPLIKAEYEAQPPAVFNADTARGAIDPPQFLWPVTSSVGDSAKGLADADVRIEQVYTTADRHHNPMEPSATLAVWRDGRLTMFDSVQGVVAARSLVAQALQLDPARVRVVTEYVGGGFGCKGWVWPHQLLAALAAGQTPPDQALTGAEWPGYKGDAGISGLSPDTSIKLDLIHKGQSKTVTVALGTMPTERQANAGEDHSAPTPSMGHLGLSVAPANEVAGSGDRGVVVTGVDPGDLGADVAGERGDGQGGCGHRVGHGYCLSGGTAAQSARAW